MTTTVSRILYFLGIKKLPGDFLLGNPYTKEQIEMMKVGKLEPSTMLNSWYMKEILPPSESDPGFPGSGSKLPSHAIVEKALKEAINNL